MASQWNVNRTLAERLAEKKAELDLENKVKS